MLKTWYKFGKNKEKGFTLIELLIVVAIIAILAAIAIPQFAAYRRRGYNAAADSDLRNMRTTEEAMFSDFQDYGSQSVAVGVGGNMLLVGALTTTVNTTLSLSPKVGARAYTDVTGVAANHTGSTPNALVTMTTTNQAGDQVYGAESDFTDLWRKPCASAGKCVDADITGPVATTSQDFTASAGWIKM